LVARALRVGAAFRAPLAHGADGGPRRGAGAGPVLTALAARATPAVERAVAAVREGPALLALSGTGRRRATALAAAVDAGALQATASHTRDATGATGRGTRGRHARLAAAAPGTRLGTARGRRR